MSSSNNPIFPPCLCNILTAEFCGRGRLWKSPLGKGFSSHFCCWTWQTCPLPRPKSLTPHLVTTSFHPCSSLFPTHCPTSPVNCLKRYMGFHQHSQKSSRLSVSSPTGCASACCQNDSCYSYDCPAAKLVPLALLGWCMGLLMGIGGAEKLGIRGKRGSGPLGCVSRQAVAVISCKGAAQFLGIPPNLAMSPCVHSYLHQSEMEQICVGS